MTCSTYPEGTTNEDGADEPHCETHRTFVNGARAHEMSHSLIRVHDEDGRYIDSADSMERARAMAGVRD